MFADILERCRDLFSSDRRDLEYLFRRHAYREEPSWVADRELGANLVRGDLTLAPLQKALRASDEDAFAQAFAQHMRDRLLPRFPLHVSAREETAAALAEDRDAANRTAAWAEQICNRTFYSLYGGAIHMGPYLDWYSDLAGKSWFYEHVRGMRDKIQRERIHETLKMGPLRATWDLNALHHLVELGKAWWLTGDDRYAQQYALQALDWMEKNPPNMGINWTDEMAVARRAIAWLFAIHLFLTAAPVTADLLLRGVKMLLMHGAFLADYLRKSKDEIRPGYRLAAASALYAVATDFPEFQTCARWTEIAETLLPAAMAEEFGDDGAHRSGSLDMHRLCCELALLPHVLAYARGHALDAETRERTAAAFHFLNRVTDADGSFQPVGASWPERALCFGPAYQLDLLGLAALAALVLSREDLKRQNRPGWTLLWLGGPDAAERYRRMGRRAAGDDPVRVYEAASLAVVREGYGEKDFFGLLRTVSSGSKGSGGGADLTPSLSPASRLASPSDRSGWGPSSHDDLLHFSAAVGTTRVFTDTGSLVLEDERGRYFDSPLAHNVLVVRDAEPVDGAAPGGVSRLDDGRFWIRGGQRGWAKGGQTVWHSRELLYVPGSQCISLLDALDGEGAHDVEVSFQSPADLEIVQRGDLGCIFWKRTGLFRLHPFFPDTFRGSVERGRDHGPPAWICRDGVSLEPLQRIRYTAKLKLPCWIVFWMTWNVSGANTPSQEEARGGFLALRERGPVRRR